jgi:hypothetical protein
VNTVCGGGLLTGTKTTPRFACLLIMDDAGSTESIDIVLVEIPHGRKHEFLGESPVVVSQQEVGIIGANVEGVWCRGDYLLDELVRLTDSVLGSEKVRLSDFGCMKTMSL